jgi:hypothetical protein
MVILKLKKIAASIFALSLFFIACGCVGQSDLPINEVTYINGKDIDLPFCLNDFGEEFYYEKIIYHDVGYASARLCFDDAYIAFVYFDKNDNEEIDQYTPIRSIDLIRDFKYGSFLIDDFITINGVNLSTPKSEANKRLGSPYKISEDFVFYYSIDHNDNNMVFSYPITGENRVNDKANYILIKLWEN